MDVCVFDMKTLSKFVEQHEMKKDVGPQYFGAPRCLVCAATDSEQLVKSVGGGRAL